MRANFAGSVSQPQFSIKALSKDNCVKTLCSRSNRMFIKLRAGINRRPVKREKRSSGFCQNSQCPQCCWKATSLLLDDHGLNRCMDKGHEAINRCWSCFSLHLVILLENAPKAKISRSQRENKGWSRQHSQSIKKVSVANPCPLKKKTALKYKNSMWLEKIRKLPVRGNDAFETACVKKN